MIEFRKYTLEELCLLKIGKTPRREVSKYWGKGYSWVSISDMRGKHITSTKEEITETAIRECSCKLIPKGTLLLSFKLSIGKLAFAGKDLYTNEAIVGLPIKDPDILYSEYLFYVLKHIPLVGSNNAAMGSTLNKESLRILELPVPRMQDQHRIVKALSQAESLVNQRKESIELLDNFLTSIFGDMFGDPVKNEKGWPTRQFSDIGKFKSGGTPSKSRPDFWNGTFPWVSPKDMKVSTIVDSQDHISDLAFNEKTLKRIPKNHLLIVVRGMILAHSFPIAVNAVEVAINQDMKAIQPSNDVDVVYLQHCLHAMKRQILDLITSAGHGTRKFDTSAMQKLFVPIPPKKHQSKFVQTVEKIEVLKAHYQNSLSELENLLGSLSQLAFNGELFAALQSRTTAGQNVPDLEEKIIQL